VAPVAFEDEGEDEVVTKARAANAAVRAASVGSLTTDHSVKEVAEVTETSAAKSAVTESSTRERISLSSLLSPWLRPTKTEFARATANLYQGIQSARSNDEAKQAGVEKSPSSVRETSESGLKLSAGPAQARPFADTAYEANVEARESSSKSAVATRWKGLGAT
jgi:hypothetical protein